MARKRKRRRLRWGPVLWLLLIANVVFGILFSPITAAAHVRIIGALPKDQARIASELDWLKGKPWPTVNGFSVEEQILRLPQIKSATLSQNVFGRGELKVSYYRPVALVDGTKHVVLTEGGFLCTAAEAPDNLPLLTVFPEAAQPTLSLSATWDPERVAEICKRAEDQAMVKNLSVTVTVSGAVCLNSGVTGRVLLGTPDDLDVKFDKMKEVLASQPGLLDQGKELVLITPSKPVTRPLQGRPQ